METLETLVKLASFGTAGVCVLAIFIIGTSIFKLANDTPEWKVSLMKKYMNICVIIAIICTISGGANAYFNRDKIVKANDKLDKLSVAYENESRNIETKRREITQKLESIQQNNPNPEISRIVESTNVEVRKLQLTPKEEILQIKENDRIRPRKEPYN